MAHEKKPHGQEHDVSNVRNVGGAHEHRDINVRGIFGFLITLTVVAILIQLVLWGMFRYLKGSYTALDPEPNPMLSGVRKPPAKDPVRDFPTPRLQADPVRDLNKMHAAEDEILHGPPVWLDEQNGVVRIPIDRAMQLTLERGLPTRPGNIQAVQGQKGVATGASAKGQTQGNNRK
jgi:hypothetical protein